MKIRRLGRTTLQVSELGHGLWGMGDWSGSDDNVSLTVLTESARLGCNFFDTAQAYGKGRSDRLLGELIRRVGRERVIIGAKVAPKNWKWPGSPNDRLEDVFPHEYTEQSVKEIAKNIGVERIDLLQFHVWDDAWAKSDEWCRSIDHLKRHKLISSFGISINRWEPENVLKALETGLVDVVQAIYNIFDQSPEDKLFPFCKQNDIGVIARVPLDEGSLGGNMTRETRFPANDWRSKYFGSENLGPTIDRIEKLKKEFPGYELSELALRFIISNATVGTVIAGMRTRAHLEKNVGYVSKGPLPNDVIAKLKHHRWDRAVTPWAN